MPSSGPSRRPSSNPTSTPTVSPSRMPTVTPTKALSDIPSRSPTSNPSPSPTASPSVHPSTKPSGSPSRTPTRSPTMTPTMSPTQSPSSFPTTTFPSSVPTLLQSASPSSSPTTSFPSSAPTMLPSFSPTSFPTRTPTQSPSVLPTPSPSRQPSASPSNGPPTICPGLDVSQRQTALADIVGSISSATDLMNGTSTQAEALNWLVAVDSLQVCPDALLDVQQRYILALMYFSTGGDNWNECSRADLPMPAPCNTGTPYLGPGDVCTWYKNVCDQSGALIGLQIGKFGPVIIQFVHNRVSCLPPHLPSQMRMDCQVQYRRRLWLSRHWLILIWMPMSIFVVLFLSNWEA